MNCKKCGGLCCYVDDSTYMYSSKDPFSMSDKLTEQYKRLADYMGDNRLVINNEKTHLLVMGSAKFAEKRKLVNIDTGNVIIKPKLQYL